MALWKADKVRTHRLRSSTTAEMRHQWACSSRTAIAKDWGSTRSYNCTSTARNSKQYMQQISKMWNIAIRQCTKKQAISDKLIKQEAN